MASSCFDDLARSFEEKSRSQDPDTVSTETSPIQRRVNLKTGRDLTAPMMLMLFGMDGRLLSLDHIESPKSVRLERESFKRGKPSDRVRQIGKAVAALTRNAMLRFCWRRLEDMLPAQVYKAVRRSIFSNFAEFVLSVFELEDFERVCNMDNRYESYPAFVSKLQQAESGSGPLVAIAEGRMDVANFSDLREHKVGEILQT